MGRLDRFGERTRINRYTIVIPNTLDKGKGTGAVARFLSRSNSLASAKAWYELLKNKTENGKNIQKISDLYELYKFYYSSSSPAIKYIEQDMLASMKKVSM